MTDKTILIAEDDATQRVMLDQMIYKDLGVHAYTAENGRKALDILKGHRGNGIKLIITDLEMPVMDGHQLVTEIRKFNPHIPIIVLTSNTDKANVKRLMDAGATDYITKPYHRERLKVTIGNALSMQRLNTEIDRLQHQSDNRFRFSDMIGYDDGLADVCMRARKVAMIDLPVLITGETGTGKELLAKAIHGESDQGGGPFIAVNCGAIPENLIESTLFGHEKGAFTGATESAIGKFREADGGTLFLDEIGELPPEAQAKLLRVLQEKEVEPVGASRPVKINVRIISATHRDLKSDVGSHRFREDLFYRLNVLDIHLLSLRDRKSDILPLCDYFLGKIAIRASQPIKAMTDDAKQKLINHDWWGNVRELENTIYKAFVLTDQNILDCDDFTFDQRSGDIQTDEISTDNMVNMTLCDMEKQLMQQALKEAENNITKAAKIIGMAKSTFYRKMKNHKIVRI